MNKIQHVVKQSISTEIFCTIYDKDGNVVEKTSPKNFITQYGRNLMASTYISSIFTYLAIGTGTQTLKREGTNISQSGTTVSASASFFVSADGTNKRAIQWADGTTARIVAYTSATEVTVDRSQTVSSQNATVYYDELKNLNVYDSSTNTYVSGANGTEITDNPDYTASTTRYWRTFRTTTFPSGETITEIGVTNTSGSNPDLVTLSNLETPLVVPAGGYADIYYSFILVHNCSEVSRTTPITGVSSDTTEMLYANLAYRTLGNVGGAYVITNSSILSSGSVNNPVSTGGYYGWFCEPSHVGDAIEIFASEKNPSALKSDPPDGGVSGDNDITTDTYISQPIVKNAYSSGTFQASITAILASMDSTSWNSYGVRTDANAIQKLCLFDSTQTFGLTNTLSVTFTKSWEV